MLYKTCQDKTLPEIQLRLKGGPATKVAGKHRIVATSQPEYNGNKAGPPVAGCFHLQCATHQLDMRRCSSGKRTYVNTIKFDWLLTSFERDFLICLILAVSILFLWYS